MSGDKTELPTEKRLQDARKEGQFAKSTVVLGSAPLWGATLALLALAPRAWEEGSHWTARVLESGHSQSPAAVLSEAVQWLVGATAAPVLGAMVLGVGAAVAQSGLFAHPAALGLKWERLDPVRGLERIFGVRQWLESAKGILVTVILGGLFYVWLRRDAGRLLRAVHAEGPSSIFEMFASLRELVFWLLSALVLLAVADYFLARLAHRRSLMMTREEVRREHKDSEGSPEQKAHRQALQRQLSLGGPARGVSSATAVVVNPTHVAVALRYDSSECDAPYIVAKGRETDALALRQEAARLKIPIVRDIPLARSLVLYDVGEQVPEELYRAAAAVLRAALTEKRSAASQRS